MTLDLGYNAYRYFYNAANLTDEFVNHYDNSIVYAVHRNCSTADVNSFEYLFDDRLTIAIALCAEFFRNLDEHVTSDFERLCSILTFKDGSGEVIVPNRCIHGQCT